MYIDLIEYQTRFSDSMGKCAITGRVKKYYQDLYAQYQTEHQIDFEKFVYNANLFGDELIQVARKSVDFNAVEITLFPSWMPTFNMDYAVPELHWKKKNEISGEFLDVRDCGSLCVFYALHLLLKLNSVNLIHSALCFSFENAIEQQIDYRAFLHFCGNKKADWNLKIHLSEIINIEEVSTPELFKKMINAFLNKLSTQSDSYFIYKRKVAENHQNEASIDIVYPDTSGFIYFCLENIAKNKKNIKYQYIFIVDYDKSCEKMGVVLVEIVLRGKYE